MSKTKIKFRATKKSNPALASTIALAVKNKPWLSVAKILSGPTRSYSKVNLKGIEEQSKVGDTLLIPGKVLSQGDLTKKVRIVALSISSEAMEKLKQTKSEFAYISEEINKNPKAEGIKVIR